MSNKHHQPVDAAARNRAMSDFDHNILVIAGAGTGKTALIIGRAIHWFLGEYWRQQPAGSVPPPGEAIASLAAITFTEKAASEMAERLVLYLAELSDDSANLREPLAGISISIQETYGISRATVSQRARSLLDVSDRAEISTIHGFCSKLLRGYSDEARISPAMTIDAQNEMRRALFDQLWAALVKSQLSHSDGPFIPSWRQLLPHISSLDALKDFCWQLADNRVPLTASSKEFIDNILGDPQQIVANVRQQLQEWWPLFDRLRAAPRMTKPGQRLDGIIGPALAALDLTNPIDALGDAADDIRAALSSRTACRNLANDVLGSKTAQTLLGAHYGLILKRLPSVLEQLGYVLNFPLAREMWLSISQIASPLLQQVWERWSAAGLLSFDDLLLFAERLVRTNLEVRAALKLRYRQLLIDEAQDTDPLQSVICSFIAELPGQSADCLADVQFEDGKLFVVGDPKQSIYGFRGADLAAFDWLRTRIDPQQRYAQTLSANFRSTSRIVAGVNVFFADRFNETTGLQPRYDPLAPGPAASEGPPLELWLATDSAGAAGGKAVSADQSRQIQGHAIAALIEQEVRQGQARHKDFAILLRAMTDVREFMEPLSQRGIPFVVAGDKDYYKRQEVLDTINLLTAILHPTDTAAFIGLLRSPLAGIPEDGLLKLARLNLLANWHNINKANSDEQTNCVGEAWWPVFTRTVDALSALRQRLSRVPSDRWSEEIQNLFPIPDIYTARYLGDRRVANVQKLLDDMTAVLSNPGARLLSWLREQRLSHDQERQESEGVLADEDIDAVRIMTIHRAKGLEFPTVFAADLSSTSRRSGDSANVLTQWTPAGREFGLAIGNCRSLHYARLAERKEISQEYEIVRLAYVAFTRARNRLILCGAGSSRGKKDAPEGAAPISHVLSALPPMEALLCPDVRPHLPDWITLRLLTDLPAALAAPQETIFTPPAELVGYESVWRERQRRCASVDAARLVVRPSHLQDEEREILEAREVQPDDSDSATDGPGAADANYAKNVGTLCHKLMEQLDYNDPYQSLTRILAEELPSLSPALPPADAERVIGEARKIAEFFFQTATFDRLRRAKIAGRELPFLLPTAPPDPPCFGVIDLVYEENDQVIVADFKTDKGVTRASIPQKAEAYRAQRQLYTEAVQQALGLPAPPPFELIFLRTGLTARL